MGVIKTKYWASKSFDFIMSDGTRSFVHDDKYVDHLIPPGSFIAAGEIMVFKVSGMLEGIKFFDA